MLRAPKLLTNLTRTASASSFQFLITLLTTPLMTRLYTPQDYAVFGMVFGAANVVAGVGMLSLTSAYANEKNVEARAELMPVLLLFLMALTVLGVAGTLAFAAVSASVSLLALALLPLLVLSGGLRQILQNVTIQRGNFARLSLVQVAEPLVSRGGSVALGAVLGSHAVWILASVMVGHLVAIRMFLKAAPAALFHPLHAIRLGLLQARAVCRRYADFMLFNTAANQLQPLAMLALQLLIAALFSGHLTGQFMLAVSILSLPVALLSLATAPVTFHHLRELVHGRSPSLRRHFLGLTLLYAGAALALYLPVYGFGASLFAFAFGDAWVEAGEIAAVLSLSFVALFTLTGMQSIAMITRRMKPQFQLDALLTLGVVLVTAYGFSQLEFHRALTWLALAWAVRHLALLAFCFLIARPMDEEVRA